MHFKQAVIQFQLSFRTFDFQLDISFKHSIVQLEHSIQTFSSNIRFDNSTFNSRFNSNWHSITQFENSKPTFIIRLGADHLTLEGRGGGGFWKKISCKRLLEEKNCMQHKWHRKKFLHRCKQEKKCCKAISSGLYKIPAKLQPFSGWFLMRLHFCIGICLKFFSPGWYVITKGTILPLVC